MSWARLDDQFADHPKVRSLGVFGVALQAAAICHCARYLTDGFLSWSAASHIIASIMAPFTLPDGQIVTPAVTSGMSGEDASEWDWTARMVECGLWEKTPKGFQVHDYLDYNPPKIKVLEERQKTAFRVAKHRHKGNPIGNAVTNALRNALETGAPSPSPSLKEKKQKLVVPADDQFLSGLKVNPAYRGIDIDRELAKMDAWLSTPKGRGRQKTKGFIVNWLNKIDRPIQNPEDKPPTYGLNWTKDDKTPS